MSEPKNLQNNTLSHLQLIARISSLCSNYPISLILDDIVPILKEMFSESVLGVSLNNVRSSKIITSISGESECRELMERILSDYFVSPSGNKSKNYRLEIQNGEFTITENKTHKLIIRGLEFGGNNYGLLAVLSRPSKRFSASEMNLVNISSRLIAASAGYEFGIKSASYFNFLKLNQTPRATINELKKEIAEKSNPSAVGIGYLIPGESSCEFFLASDDAEKQKPDFYSDMSIAAVQFDLDKTTEIWKDTIDEAPLPKTLLAEMSKRNVENILFYPLKGKSDYFGFCVVGFGGAIPDDNEERIRDIISDYRQRLLASAAFNIIISNYRKLLTAEKLELIKLTAATVNHHINNQLSVILGSAQLLLLKEDLPMDVREKIEIIEGNTLQIKDIISTLRNIRDINIAEYMAGDKYLDIL